MLIGSWFDSGSHLSLGWRGAEVQVLGFVGVEVVLLGLHHPAHPNLLSLPSSATLPGPPPTDPTQGWGRSLLPTSPLRRWHRHHLGRGGGGWGGGEEVPPLIQVLADVRNLLGVSWLGLSHLWPPPCSASSATPSHQSTHPTPCSAQKLRCTSPTRVLAPRPTPASAPNEKITTIGDVWQQPVESQYIILL